MLLKICCIQDEDELTDAAAAGATHVGLVGAMPSGPGPIPDSAIRDLARRAPSGVRPVLLTARTEAAGIVDHVRATGVHTVQIVAPVDGEVRAAVREALPGIEIIQVVHVEHPDSVGAADAAAGGSDFVLLDSGRPSASVPELGGTGRVHDWELSVRIVGRVGVPVLLAGGLDPTNVRSAIDAVRPAGVDVCSGLRDASGRLDREALDSFARAVRPR